MKSIEKFNQPFIFFRCTFYWDWMSECSGISEILLSFKYLHFDLSLWRNTPSIVSGFPANEMFKGLNVGMNGSAQFRSGGGGKGVDEIYI